MKKIFKVSVSKVYIMYLLLLTVFVIGTYSSYAYFTVNKEKKNAIKMVTGNLVGELKVDGVVNDQLIVPANTSKSFTIELINKNDRSARFNFYYKGSLKEGVEVGYIQNDGYNTMPSEKGVNLEANGTLGYYQKYRIKVKNNTSDSVTIQLGYNVGLDYNDLTLPSDSHLFSEMKMNPNEPKLASNMIPVRYDGTNWVKADKSNWYNYDNLEWANAVTIDNSKVLDLSGNNNHGTINGATISNGEADFDGVDDYIDCGLNNYDFGNQISFVIKMKLNNNPTTLNYEMFGNCEVAGGSIAVKINKQVSFVLYSEETTSYVTIDSNQQLEVGVYYTIVGTYDGNYMRIYINGDLAAEKQVKLTIKESSMPIYVGANPNPGGVSNPSNVKVSNVLVFNKELSASEVKEHYSNEVSLGSTKPLFYYNFKQGENISNNTIIPMDLINTMWVWIPRYSYTIGSEDGNNYYGKKGEFLTTTPTKALPGEIDVEFVDKNTKDRGTAKYKVSDSVSGWYTPDGFTFGKEELEGIWVGKFETSNKEEIYASNSSTLTPIIKPNVKSWFNIKISTLETVSMKMNKENNVYGFLENEIDTHAAKGSEWVLASYLSQSKYGKLGNKNYSGENKEIFVNSYDGFKTGCSSGTTTDKAATTCAFSYDNLVDRGGGKGAGGAGASTTGNIYGIYDMSGGCWDYIMTNFDNYSGKTQTQNSGYTGLLSDGTSFQGIPYPDQKYYDKYISADINIISHALGETSGWYSDNASMIRSDVPWLLRGGSYSFGGGTGLFSYGLATQAGDIGFDISFRVVLTNK